jgi:hypothetical protein
MDQAEILRRYHHPDMQKVGERVVKDAQEHQAKRREHANNECGQAAKEAASYLVGKVSGRASVIMDGFKK